MGKIGCKLVEKTEKYQKKKCVANPQENFLFTIDMYKPYVKFRKNVLLK
jgi:hypothetical protein